MTHFEHAMKVMAEELVASSPEPVERRVSARLMADLGINESEAEAYADATYARYYEAYTK